MGTKLSRRMLKAAKAVILAVSLLSALPSTAQEKKTGTPEQTKLIESLNGATLFQAYCASCHGPDAKGNGPAAAALKAKAPDLTRISERNHGQFPANYVQRFIAGDDMPAAHGSRVMPIWGPVFSQIAWDQDLGKIRIYNLRKYIESLQKK